MEQRKSRGESRLASRKPRAMPIDRWERRSLTSKTRRVVDMLKIAWQSKNTLCFYISPYCCSEDMDNRFFAYRCER